MGSFKRKKNAILESLCRVRKIHPCITLNEFEAFLYVAENPGINIGDLAELCGIQLSSMSRIVRSLSLIPALGGEGTLALLQIVPNPFDLRERFLTLSDQGDALAASLDSVIERSIAIDSKSKLFRDNLGKLREDVA